MLQTKSIVLTIFIAVICEVEMVNAVDLNREISESLKEARELIENEQYETAFDILIVEITKNPNDADAHNLAGFAARNPNYLVLRVGDKAIRVHACFNIAGFLNALFRPTLQLLPHQEAHHSTGRFATLRAHNEEPVFDIWRAIESCFNHAPIQSGHG